MVPVFWNFVLTLKMERLEFGRDREWSWRIFLKIQSYRILSIRYQYTECLPDTMWSPLHRSIHFIFIITFHGWYCHHPHETGEKTFLVNQRDLPQIRQFHNKCWVWNQLCPAQQQSPYSYLLLLLTIARHWTRVCCNTTI